MLKRILLMLLKGVVCLFLANNVIFAQEISNTPSETKVDSAAKSAKSDDNTSDDDSKKRRFEAGIHFTSLMKKYDGDRNGFGARFGYRFATFGKGKYTATAEAEVNYLPGDNYTLDFRRSGRVLQGLFGVKIGRKFDKFGVFGKVRPGVTRYSRGDFTGVYFQNNPKSKTNFTTDIGGVLEFYPSKRLFTRFDFGDTIVRLQSKTVTFFPDPPFPTPNPPNTYKIPATNSHHFSFSAGFGFRF
jgi:hypothetical protein